MSGQNSKDNIPLNTPLLRRRRFPSNIFKSNTFSGISSNSAKTNVNQLSSISNVSSDSDSGSFVSALDWDSNQSNPFVNNGSNDSIDSSSETQNNSTDDYLSAQSSNGFSEQTNESQKGHAIQIAKVEHGKFVLKSKTLSNILLADNVRHRSVVVVSIAGDMRKGKSFLLNFFLRYLQSGCGAVDDWIGRNQNQPLKGFHWRGGSQRDTIGIWMWSQPFILKRDDGREMAVLLMDTQGCFDCEDTVKDSAIIFALSLLTSSTFIYNLHHNIQENNLDNLHVFSDYGILALSGQSEEKPFQRLVFLVRDWSFPTEYPYGRDGGDKKLNRYLVEQKTEKNKRVRDFIENSFQERIGFLMPYPGKTVATDPQFKGRIADMDPQFSEQLEQFIPLMLSPNNLVIKKIGGTELDGHKLYLYFNVFSDKFSGDELPEPKSLLEATAEVNNLIAVEAAINHYSRHMNDVCGGDTPYLSKNSLKASHLRYRDEALTIFDRTPKMGGTEFSDSHRNNLFNRIKERFKHFEEQNESKDLFKRFRPPLYALAVCVVAFILYHLLTVSGFVVVGQLFFIVSTVCLGIFVDLIMHWREGLIINQMELVVVSVGMTAIGLFLLYWRQILIYVRDVFLWRQNLPHIH